MEENLGVLTMALIGGFFIFSLLIIYACYTVSKRKQNEQLPTVIQNPQLIQQQQQQQQQHPAVENSTAFSIYPVKPELDPPPSYESVISQ
jgi:hypothetical protein